MTCRRACRIACAREYKGPSRTRGAVARPRARMPRGGMRLRAGAGARSRRAFATQAGALQRARVLWSSEMPHCACAGPSARSRWCATWRFGGVRVGARLAAFCEIDARAGHCVRAWARRTRSHSFNLAPRPAVHAAASSHLVHLSDAGMPAHVRALVVSAGKANCGSEKASRPVLMEGEGARRPLASPARFEGGLHAAPGT